MFLPAYRNHFHNSQASSLEKYPLPEAAGYICRQTAKPPAVLLATIVFPFHESQGRPIPCIQTGFGIDSSALDIISIIIY
jgi:hypothetical protein